MAAEVKKLETKPATAPAASEPIACKYWIANAHIGTGADRGVTIGATMNDSSGTQGRVRAIWFYPVGGFAIAEVEQGWRPGVPESQLEMVVKRLILTGGHGCAL